MKILETKNLHRGFEWSTDVSEAHQNYIATCSSSCGSTFEFKRRDLTCKCTGLLHGHQILDPYEPKKVLSSSAFNYHTPTDSQGRKHYMFELSLVCPNCNKKVFSVSMEKFLFDEQFRNVTSYDILQFFGDSLDRLLEKYRVLSKKEAKQKAKELKAEMKHNRKHA